MLDDSFQFINEEFEADKVSSVQLDRLLANGWRHFGTHFYRYSFAFYGRDIRLVIPLRIRLSNFSPTKSQRRVLRTNADLQTLTRRVEITSTAKEMFHRHKSRFSQSVPNSIYDFLSRDPALVPCDAREVAVYDSGRLIAASYFDMAERSISGIYAMFEPADEARSLGIFTLLKEIEFAIDAGKDFYYLGYCYEGESFYDYKKRFRGTEMFDWNSGWKSFENIKADAADPANDLR